VDPENDDNKIEVPPYTSPGDFMASIKKKGKIQQQQKQQQSPESITTIVTSMTNDDVESPTSTSTTTIPVVPATAATTTKVSTSSSSYDETTFDGYQDIQQANSRTSREDELLAMKVARQQNRMGQDQIDPNKIGLF
jgi:hypothetical protein